MELAGIQGLKGTVSVPGDKSISHRCIMFGSIANGTTEIHNFLKGADCLATIRCFQSMGINIEETDYLITALLGGGLCGSGVGLVLLSGASTGGTDMLAVLLHKYLKNYSVIQIMQYLDALIVAAGAAVFGIYVSLYAIIAIYITTVISDNILEGTKHGVAAFVITDNYEIIADIIKRDMNRGVTLIKGQGMYSYKPKNMLLCVVSRKEISQLKQICVEKDRESFILISDVREVMGEGFVQNIQ